MQSDDSTSGGARYLADEAATIAAGREVAQSLGPAAVIGLVGDLGAGKTSFSKGLVSGLGFEGDVSSPTFTLLHEYVGGRLTVYHFDFYRLESVEQLWEIGWDEYLSAEGVIIAEWADKFPVALPPETAWIALRYRTDGRDIEVLKCTPPVLE